MLPLLDVVVSEAVCNIQFAEVIDLNGPAGQLADHAFEHGYIEQYNDNFLENIAGLRAEEVRHLPVARLFTANFRELLEDFFAQGCRLFRRSYRRAGNGRPEKHYDVNMRGYGTEDRISHLWMSFHEVTETVDLKKKIITSLEQQQTQLGRELHDSIGQLLTSVRILSENLVSRLPPDRDDEVRVAERILEYATEASEEISYLERGLLISEELSEEGLSRAVQKVVDRTDSLPGISCTFVNDVHETIGNSSVRLHLYRIVQEAVNNAVRHGNPDTIEVSLRTHEGSLQLVISDNGTGFNPEETDSHGLGLNSMKYRAAVIGAELDVDSGINRGTTVHCTLAHPQTNS